MFDFMFYYQAFGRVCMLYVPAQVNKTDIIAFVDSGAQSTIMSEDVAKKCGFEGI